LKELKYAIYTAIFLHQCRKIFHKVYNPRPAVTVRVVNGRKLFQADPDRVRAASRKIRASYSEEQMCSMVGYDVEALLMESLQQEIQAEACKRPSLGKLFDECARPMVVTQDDIDSGRVRPILIGREINAFSRREPGYTIAPPCIEFPT
jgi:hypothetical protein